jgi:hypothetical protein
MIKKILIYLLFFILYINNIANANSSVFIGNQRVNLRVSRSSPERGNYFSGIGLLHTVGLNDLEKAQGQQKSRLSVYNHTNRKGEVKSSYSLPITLNVLETLVGDQAFDANGESNVNQGFGLRMPVSKVAIQPGNRTVAQTRAEWRTMLPDFEIGLHSVEPTEVSIGNIQKPFSNDIQQEDQEYHLQNDISSML